MGLATEPPIRADLGCRSNDDKLVPVLWLRADGETAVVVTGATLTMRFDLPDDDTWPRDPVTEVPIPPVRQTHTIDDTSPAGDPGGWVDPTHFADGQVLAVISHEIWATFDPPLAGTWDLVAVSTDSVQRCLARGEFACELGADQP